MSTLYDINGRKAGPLLPVDSQKAQERSLNYRLGLHVRRVPAFFTPANFIFDHIQILI
jgi:hypothetical protein